MSAQDPQMIDEAGVPDTVQLLKELLEVRRRMTLRARPSQPPPPRRASVAPPPAAYEA